MLEIKDEGIIIPDTTQIQSDIEQVFINALGSNFNTSPETVNGQIIQELVLLFRDEYEKLAFLFNSYDVNKAQGIFLDNLTSIFGIYRKEATATRIDVRLTGVSGLVIPVNSQLIDGNGKIYQNTSDITINNGQVDASFYCTTLGKVDILQTDSIKILSSINGWDSVSLLADGVAGEDKETDAELRARFLVSRSQYASGTYEAVYSGLSSIASDVNLIENATASPITIDGITLPPHSLLSIIEGGLPYDITDVFYKKKSAGCVLVGDESLTINPTTLQEFTARWNRPVYVDLKIQVSILFSAFSSQPSDYQNKIIENVLTLFNSENKIGFQFVSGTYIASLDEIGIQGIVGVQFAEKTAGTFANFYTLRQIDKGRLSSSDIIIVEV